MLRGAVQKHEKENATAPAPKPFFASSPPVQPDPSSQSSNNPSFRNPLKPTTTNSLNALGSSQQRVQSGTKRMASGLAKALDGSFEEGPGSHRNPISLDGASPQKGKVLQITKNDFIDEDDFDSDIDLDIEEPPAKKTVQYPTLPKQNGFAPPPKPIVYPTLPRQQEMQSGISNAIDSAYQPSLAQDSPGSSVPLPWSSSPAEHFAPAIKPSIKSFTYNPTATQRAQNGPPPPQPPPKAKRRTLPWHTQDEIEEVVDQPAPTAARPQYKASTTAAATPQVKDKKSPFPWNTSASAMKEQHKKHREENKKTAVKVNEGDDESTAKAKSSRQQVAKVFLSEEQQHVVDLVENKKKSVFFTGSAGTGKSVLMREIIAALRRKYKREPDRVAVTASTGLAACNIGGVTLHSFAGIGLGKEDVPELVKKIKKNQKAKQRWLRTKVLIVDEVSMVDGDLFDKLEAIARQLRNNGRPFGGIQLVITGDFFQLPPVPDHGRVAKFAFDAATWTTAVEHTIGLHHVFRQKDPIFAGMLNEMREGRLQQSSIRTFQSLNRPLNFRDDLEATELFPTRSEVEVANQTRLGQLQGQSQIFDSRDGGAIVDKPQRDKLLSNCLAPEQIILKKGAQVMLIKNIDEGLVNGSLGRVMGFMDEQKFDRYTSNEEEFAHKEDGTFATQRDPDFPAADSIKRKLMESISTSSRQWPVVRFMIADGTSRDLLCQPEIWKVELPNGEVQASRTQVPLILAWALSIHKAQGQTLERVKVDLGKVFEKGQAYVALSRATSMAGLQVLRFDPKKVVAHDKVRTFYSNLSRIELAEKNKERMGKIEGVGGKKKGGLVTAESYEKSFVEDEWVEFE